MRVAQTAGTSLALLASLATAAQAVQCYSGVNVFTARGTFEQPPDGLGLSGVHINAILAAVPDSYATVIQYPATFGNTSVNTGVQNGTRQITEYLDACPSSKIVVMGYSQGADVMGLVLTGASFTINPEGEAQNYTVPPLASKYGDQIAAVVFFGDPQYNVNLGKNLDAPYPCTHSSDAPRDSALFATYADRLEEMCNHDDLYCCAGGGSLAAHLSYFSAENGTLTADFVLQQLGLASNASSSTTPSVTTPAPPTYTVFTPPPPPGVASSAYSAHAVSALSIVYSSPSPRASTVSRASRYSSASSISRYSSASGTGRVPVATTTSTSPSHSPVSSPRPGAATRLSNPVSVLTGLLSALLYLV